jgi:hypothetical protein
MGRARRRIGNIVIAFALVAAPTPVRGACPSVVRGAVSERGANLSAQWLYDVQVTEARRARTWRYAWTGINGALAVGQFALIPWASNDQRLEFAVGGVGSTATAIVTWFVPLEVEATLGRSSDANRPCERLRVEEQFATAASADESGRVTWPWHALSLAGGLGYMAIVGIGTGNWDKAALDGAAAFVLGELQLFTQPTRLASRFETYARRDRRTAWGIRPANGGIAFYVGAMF